MNLPPWTKWAAFILFVLGTYTAVLVWASDAHSENQGGIIENRARLEQNSADHQRIEEKLDTLLFHLIK